ncbi:hypothetical protein [Emticicia sp. SJ17W-69]|uniref:hypothetical protein n=1 Tax=Emticicia sp. SJ17W-69 TaxID=3421657 RepID=UPI003EBF9249
MNDIFSDIEQAEQNRKKFSDDITASKYDLDSLLTEFRRISMSYYDKGMTPEEQKKFPKKEFSTRINGQEVKIPIDNNIYVDLITLIDTMYPSLIAPFHHYNNYIDFYCKDFLWDDIKYDLDEDEPRDSNTLRKIKYQIEIQALLMSIKAGLDRFVSFFSYYFNGISPHTTFGRYKKEKDKYDGFMYIVNAKKEKDSLMAFIHAEYFDWIKIAVAPRDTITHYNDLGIYYEFNSEIQGDIPVHYNERLIKEKGQAVSPVFVYSYQTIKGFTESWHKFISKTFLELLTKDLITYHPKF